MFGRGAEPKQAMSDARQGDLGLCVLCPLSLSLQAVPRCKKSGIVCLVAEGLMFWCSLIGANRPLKEAIACLEQEDLGFGVLCWEWKVIRAEIIADGRVPLPARSG